MANHKSALKRHRQSLKRRARNRISKTRIKNTVKAVRLAIEEKDVTKAQEALKEASSILDKAARKSIIHERQAQRRIARLQTAVNKIAE
ncbi:MULTISPECIES: 30S ribosomal protein S20 [unclassified Pseudodesulfovibrio]|uniref:30S ribosomal protein S20 n=1 Tax=unclassified Pseudodesulfovibrio TaxID=2661612 RepID=UPI000FEB9DC4|nr:MULTISPECIES: 30S ribosomal protein S20 [unclassified Pseudodesulfovibrio]MCJ2163759.1 30S ribosomal protein S20 [Pseudodesulfovibrio sp. S3-i]RWU05991.1 30S ribosomal protein S20 [Pseudodesulfovibrio sp. S3]